MVEPPHGHGTLPGHNGRVERRSKPRLRNGQIEFDFKKGINPNPIVYFVKTQKINARSILQIVKEEIPHFAELVNALKELREEENVTDFSDYQDKTEHNTDLLYYNGKVNELRKRCQRTRLSELTFKLMYTPEFQPSEFQRILLEQVNANPINKPLTVFLFSLRLYANSIDKPGKEKEQQQFKELLQEMQKRE